MEKLFNIKNRSKLNYLLATLGAGAFAFLSYWFVKNILSKRIKSLMQGKETKQKISILTQKEANERSKLIRDLSYTLYLQLKADSILNVRNIYEGSILLEFFYTGDDKDSLFIDFIGNIESLIINNRKTANFTHSNGKLSLDTSQLKPHAINKINIKFSSNYENVEHGIRLYIDPEDSV
jgi:hypothetical protein